VATKKKSLKSVEGGQHNEESKIVTTETTLSPLDLPYEQLLKHPDG